MPRVEAEQENNERAMTAAQLLAEGVLEVGAVTEAVLYVFTNKGLRLFHVERIEDRQLDEWGIAKAIDRLNNGTGLKETAREVGIAPRVLRRQLDAVGYDQRDARTLARRARETRRLPA